MTSGILQAVVLHTGKKHCTRQKKQKLAWEIGEEYFICEFFYLQKLVFRSQFSSKKA